MNGDWSRALNDYARAQKELELSSSSHVHEKENASIEGGYSGLGVPIQVMLDGPYGGCGIDLGRYESVLLVAGGSGATFTIGLLDDIVGRCVKLGRRGGERTRRIEFAWCIRSFGELLQVPGMMGVSVLMIAILIISCCHISSCCVLQGRLTGFLQF